MTSEIKFNDELLNTFCKEHNLDILEKTDISEFKCNVKLTGKCNTENCTNFFNKNFNTLYKTRYAFKKS